MAAQRNPTRPSETTLKRLFARSGNQCAFPRCTATLIEGETLVGKVCHIKAAKPRGPRYDPHQTAAERHRYDNLLLLCGTHHTVIDDDEDAYTVERLVRMKAVHEQSAAPVDGALADHAARLLINQTVTSTNQSGGISANTVNAGTINLHAPLSHLMMGGGTPDWTIHDLFYYLRPTISPDGPTSEWDDVGNDVLDKLSAGQLPAWGREIVRQPAVSYLNLTPIDRGYWRAARFTYAFLLDDHESDIHVSQNPPSRLPDYGDVRVSREEAVALWPHPMRARWSVSAIELIARYFNAAPAEVSIPCTSLSLFDAQIETHYDGSGQPQYQRVVAPAHIVASGIDPARIWALSWSPQLLSFVDPATNTEQIFVLTSVDAFASRGKVKFFVESPEAIAVRRFAPEQLERARELITERLNCIPAGIDAPTVLRHGPRLVVHVIPASAFEGRSMDSRAPQLLGQHFRLDGYETIDGRPRVEGWVWFQPPQPVPGLPSAVSQWYSRLDLNGFVEIALTLDGPDVEGAATAIRGYPLERYIVRTLDAVADGYASLQLQSPVVICVTLFGVLGAKLVKSTAGFTSGFDRSVVTTQELELPEMKKPLGRALRPLLDTLWRAAGWADGSPSYARGDWDGYANPYPYG